MTPILSLLFPKSAPTSPLHRRQEFDSSPPKYPLIIIGVIITLFFAAVVCVICSHARKRQRKQLEDTVELVPTMDPPRPVDEYALRNPRGSMAVFRVPTDDGEMPPPPTYQEARTGKGTDAGRVGTVDTERMEGSRPSYLEAVGYA